MEDFLDGYPDNSPPGHFAPDNSPPIFKELKQLAFFLSTNQPNEPTKFTKHESNILLLFFFLLYFNFSLQRQAEDLFW